MWPALLLRQYPEMVTCTVSGSRPQIMRRVINDKPSPSAPRDRFRHTNLMLTHAGHECD